MASAVILLAAVPVVAAVLLIGALADFGDPYSRTAFALGVVAAIPGFLIGSALDSRPAAQTPSPAPRTPGATPGLPDPTGGDRDAARAAGGTPHRKALRGES